MASQFFPILHGGTVEIVHGAGTVRTLATSRRLAVTLGELRAEAVADGDQKLATIITVRIAGLLEALRHPWNGGDVSMARAA